MTMTEERATLPPFEGQDVEAAAVKITKAGDGLSDALAVAPKALHCGGEVTYVLRGRVSQVNHLTKGKGSGKFTRQHTIECIDITEVDGSEFATLLADNRDRVNRELEQLKGIQRLDDALEDEGYAGQTLDED